MSKQNAKTKEDDERSSSQKRNKSKKKKRTNPLQIEYKTVPGKRQNSKLLWSKTISLHHPLSVPWHLQVSRLIFELPVGHPFWLDTIVYVFCQLVAIEIIPESTRFQPFKEHPAYNQVV